MLVQFKMKNVLSFKEETIFDMTAISAYKEHPSNLIDIDTKEKFLRVAAIYGANASGKSNFVWALKLFRRIVSQSLKLYRFWGMRSISMVLSIILRKL